MQYSKTSLNVSHLLGSSSQKISQICFTQQCLVYLCGCYIIFYSPYLDQQIGYIKHRNSNISTITTTKKKNQNGQEIQSQLAVAQQGKMPIITIYSIDQIDQKQPKIKYQLKGHKNTIDFITYSPNNKYLVSLSNKDCSMFIWQNGIRISQNRISKPTGDLITIGKGQFKLWKFDKGQIQRKQEQDCWMIQGRSLTFGKKFSTTDFIDMAIYKTKILALSYDGFLCIISKQEEKVQKWIQLMMSRSSSIQVYDNFALISGQNSIIKVINLETLNLQARFPKPPPNLKENITNDELLQYHQNQSFPKCNGVKKIGQLVITLYQNRTIFVWKIEQDIKALRSVISHQKTITSLCLLEQIKGDISFFGTTSQDCTIRIWHFYKKYYQNQKRQSIDLAQLIGIKRNVYCRNLTRIIYTDSHEPILKMKILGQQGKQKQKSVVCISCEQFMMYSLQNFELVAHDYFDSKQKAMSLQTRGDQILVGFQSGLIMIYNVTDSLEKVSQIKFQFPIEQLTVNHHYSHFSIENYQGNNNDKQEEMKIQNKKPNSHPKNNSILTIFGKKNLIVYSFDQQDVIFEQTNISTITQSSNYIIYCTNQTIHIHNIQNKNQNLNLNSHENAEKISKKSPSSSNKNKNLTISFTHQVQPDQIPFLVKSNQWLIVILTNKSRLIIANFSAIILHTQKINQNINDIEITQNGQIIMVSSKGTISILKFNTGKKYQNVQNKVKKWFQENDMSWMDGSVWRSQNIAIKNKKQNTNTPQQREKDKSGQKSRQQNYKQKQKQKQSPNNKPKSKQDIIIPLNNSDSFYKVGDQSVGFPSVQLPNININYKSQNNKMSVFNPSNIVDQANKIYKNINQRIKNQSKIIGGGNKASHLKSPRFDDSSLQEIKLSNIAQSSARPRRKIFGGNAVQQNLTSISKGINQNHLNINPLMGNLVTSTYHRDPNKNKNNCQEQSMQTFQNFKQKQKTQHPYISNKVQTQESIDAGYIQMQRISLQSQDQNYNNGNVYQTILDEIQQQLINSNNSQEFISKNRQKLKRLYTILSYQFSDQSILQEKRKLSQKDQHNLSKKLQAFTKQFYNYFKKQEE